MNNINAILDNLDRSNDVLTMPIQHLFPTEPIQNKIEKPPAPCPMSKNELITLMQVFSAWTGLSAEYPDDDGSGYYYFSEQQMLDELQEVRDFCNNDLNEVFGLSGAMAEINQTLFMSELDKFTEEELIGYVKLFHIDVTYLQEFQEKLLVDFNTLSHREGVTDEELTALEDSNEERLLSELKSIILEFRMKMIDRFRLWRWREEILLDGAGEKLEEYPGVEIHFQFETTLELVQNGIQYYYMRVGEAKRENLMSFYNYVDLYHIAGILSQGIKREVLFGTSMTFEDLADMILSMIDELELDPRYLITPLGIRNPTNFEVGETIYNLNRMKDVDDSRLATACSKAGIELSRITEDVDENGVVTITADPKPASVLLEEYAAQVVSPQFFSGVESFRDWKSTVSSFKTLSDARLLMAEEGEIIFYGVGDGFSAYRIYTPSELSNTFASCRSFVDPYSIKDYPEDSRMWLRFSHPSIMRLLQTVIPKLKVKAKTRLEGGRRWELTKDLENLEEVIMDVLNEPVTFSRLKQDEIVDEIKDSRQVLTDGLSSFLAFLFNLGVQFSDWSTAMLTTTELAKQMAIVTEPDWKYVDPETTDFLTGRIYKMLTTDVEKYLDKLRLDEDGDFTRHVLNLRLVKKYGDAYRLDWNDEAATIGGHIHRMIKYADLGLYPQIQMSGNWLMTTSHYYSIVLLDQDPAQNIIEISDGPSLEEHYNF